MSIISPLATLIATLADVCQQAQQHQALLSKNEAATRAALINPVLQALGWDISDMRMVEPESTVQNKQSLDYVLKSRDGAILAVVEAKKLGEPLDKLGHVGALIGYAFSLKPSRFFITDGLHWHCYSPGHSQFEPVAILKLNQENLLSTGLQLLQLLDAAHGGHGVAETTQNQLSKSTSLLAKAVAKPKEAAVQVSKNYVLLTSALALEASGKPAWLRLPDGSEHQLKSWKDILLAACKLVLNTRPDLALPIPDKAGKKTALLRREQPTKGLSFTTISYQGQPAYIYTNYSATDCLANAMYILKLLPKAQQLTSTALAFSH
jgi:hypothetical protein